MTALAEFHHAAASFPLPDLRRSISPGIEQRQQRLRSLMAGGLNRLSQRIIHGDWPELAARARHALELFPIVALEVDTTLAQAMLLRVPLQPCIRDVWHDHLLFQGEEVSGLIDFGALRPENVAADVARLLGSLVADDTEGWAVGMATYEAVRPLSPPEAVLVSAFDRANGLLSVFNWLLWHYEEERLFENRAGVLARLDHHLGRLEHLAARN
jgi:homoserine kinase type II